MEYGRKLESISYAPLGETGMMISNIAFGCVQLGLVKPDSPEESEAVKVVVQAVKCGINYLDTAPWYGNGTSELVLGKALKQLPRSSYYVATKVGRYLPDYHKMFDFTYERTLASVNESLARLGLDYVDVIQVHDLEFAPSLDVVLNETLPALKRVVEEGKARFIGITGYPVDKLKETIMRSTVPINVVLSYSRLNLFDKTLQEYIPFFKERGIGVINAAFLGMGLLTPFPLPEWHPAGQEVRSVCKRALQYCQDEDVDLSKLATCYVLRQKEAATNIIGFNSLDLLEKNLNSVQKELNDKEEKVLHVLLEEYFVNNLHWEGIEVNKYWSKIKSKSS